MKSLHRNFKHLAQGKPTNVDFQNPFMDPVEFSLQASAQDPSHRGNAKNMESLFVGARNRKDLSFQST